MTKLILSAVVLVFLVLNTVPATAATCESLAGLKLPNTTITLAQSVAAGAFAPAGGGGRGGAQFSDLPAFWRGSYAAVRSDLRGRYPRHPWPDDPLSAQATRRAKPRGQ